MSKENGFGIWAVAKKNVYFGLEGTPAILKGVDIVNVLVSDSFVGEWLTKELNNTKYPTVFLVGRAIHPNAELDVNELVHAPHMGRVGILPQDFIHATRLM